MERKDATTFTIHPYYNETGVQSLEFDFCLFNIITKPKAVDHGNQDVEISAIVETVHYDVQTADFTTP